MNYYTNISIHLLKYINKTFYPHAYVKIVHTNIVKLCHVHFKKQCHCERNMQVHHYDKLSYNTTTILLSRLKLFGYLPRLMKLLKAIVFNNIYT